MAQLRQDYEQFTSQKTEILIVGPEKPDAFAKFWRDEKLPFIGLADPSHSVLKLYGQKVNLFKLGRMPAQAIIDRKGIVRFIHYGHSMQDIPDNIELLQVLDVLNQETAETLL